MTMSPGLACSRTQVDFPAAGGPEMTYSIGGHHARDARGAGGVVLAPLELLHLRAQTGQPVTPCAGRRLAGLSGSPPLLSGMTWSMVSAAPCPHIQHV